MSEALSFKLWHCKYGWIFWKTKKNWKKIDFFKNEIKSLKKSKRCDLRKRFKISQKKIWWCWDKNSKLCFILKLTNANFIYWAFSTTVVFREGDWFFFLKMKWFFTNIVWLVCRVVTIVLLTQRTRLGEPFRYLEHVRTVHSKFSRGVWKKVSA